MNIQTALLGLLSWKSFSGYDLKKIIASSPAFYWSGNNNQIYTALVQMAREGLVETQIDLEGGLPARKVYTITDQGRAALRAGLQGRPQAPEVRNPFLIQLAWADLLNDDELDTLLGQYEEEVGDQLNMLEEQTRRGEVAPQRNPRETFLWQQIGQNLIAFYWGELDWVRGVRQGLVRQMTD